MAGDHEDAMSRLDDLIAMVPDNSIYYVIQARATLPHDSDEYHR